jgi:hypothetical protein
MGFWRHDRRGKIGSIVCVMVGCPFLGEVSISPESIHRWRTTIAR